MIKLDLHTHSEASKDGGITPEEYADLLKNEVLDVVAITDHNRIDFARGMQTAFGEDKIIVGEEISTTDGDIIGLYLKERIEPGLSAQATIDEIKAQNGLVYIPHPFETARKGVSREIVATLVDDIDIMEAFNGRAFVQNFSADATALAKIHSIPIASSSDAHHVSGVGTCYTVFQELPNRKDLLEQLKKARLVTKRPPFYSLFYPKYNRFVQFFKGNN